jgi:hypothetical protein
MVESDGSGSSERERSERGMEITLVGKSVRFYVGISIKWK